MGVYVMSDIHGQYEKFIKMLKLINFNKNDKLYILGDILDRGDKALDILDHIIKNKNIILLKGNHEKMCEEFYDSDDMSLWKWNGGIETYNQIIKKGRNYEYFLYKYIRSLPIIKIVDKYILVHAGLYLPKNIDRLSIDEFMRLQEEDINLWSRDNIYSDVQYKDYKIICGHTPVQVINNNYNDVKIIHRKGHIYIDCGACFFEANGKLACLRLDDLEEFYV